MATVDQIASAARARMRDFGHFFEAPFARSAPVIRLPHPMVDATRLVAWTPDGTKINADQYLLDSRNGVVQMMTPSDYPAGLAFSGYYFEWFLDEDFAFHAASASLEILSNTNGTEEDLTGLVADVAATYTVVKAWWSLLSELALDIDVSTPEGMMIPASQRFRQVWEMANFWYARYQEVSALAGIGIYAIEQFNLRRIAYLTNRLVPVFKEREVDDPTPPLRLLPEIPDGLMAVDEISGPSSVYMPSADIGVGVGGGWFSIGSGGAP